MYEQEARFTAAGTKLEPPFLTVKVGSSALVSRGVGFEKAEAVALDWVEQGTGRFKVTQAYVLPAGNESSFVNDMIAYAQEHGLMIQLWCIPEDRQSGPLSHDFRPQETIDNQPLRLLPAPKQGS